MPPLKDNRDVFKNKYRIASSRLPTWDYSSNGLYFITICIKDRQHYFGKIINDEMVLNEIGKVAAYYWSEIPKHFKFVSLDEFQVMPNHFHGILKITNSIEIETGQILSAQSLLSSQQPSNDLPHPRFRNQGKNTISSIVGSYKSSVKKHIKSLDLEFGWQTRFHDHIIRSHDEFIRISNYVVNNPRLWKEDRFYS